MSEGSRSPGEERILTALEQKIQEFEADRNGLSAVIEALKKPLTCNEMWVAVAYIALGGSPAAAAALRDSGIRKSPTSLYHPPDVRDVATTSEKVPEPIRRLASGALYENLIKNKNRYR